MNVTLALVRRRLFDAARKYLNTWTLLLRTPADFMKLSLEDKATCCTPPWSFFVSSLIVVPAILAPVSYIALHFLDPSLELIPSSMSFWDIGLSNPYWSGANIVFVTFLWYIVFVRVLKLRLNIRTTTPGRRILYELMYIYSGPSQLFCVGSVVVGTVFHAAVVSIIRSSRFSPVQSEVLAIIIMVLIAVVSLTLNSILPLLIIPLRYDVLIATTVFSISRIRAYLICGVISFVAFSIMLGISIRSVVLFPSQLTKPEREAVDCLFSLARLESRIYPSINHFGLPLDELIDELSMIDLPNDVGAYIGTIATADIRNIKLVS